MICPRCGNEWDATQSPCTRCGLVVRIRSVRGASAPLQEGASSFDSMLSSNAGMSGDVLAYNMRPTASPPQTQLPFQGNAVPPIRGNEALPPTPQNPYTARFGGSAPLSSPGAPTSTPFSSPRQSSSAPPPPAEQRGRTMMPTEAPQTPPAVPRVASLRPPQQSQAPATFFTSPTSRDFPPAQSPLRPHHIVPDPSAPSPALSASKSTGQATSASPSSTAPSQLLPGALLRGGRYRLQEQLGRQEWSTDVYEATWSAQDAQRGMRITICEVALPESNSTIVQTTLRTATNVLNALGRHPRIPSLLDAFSDHGRNFFAFEAVEGETLIARMRRTGLTMRQDDVIECCLQMSEILEWIWQQSQQLAHGLISPERIVLRQNGMESQYILTGFSIILAGGARQFISGIEPARLSPYAAPEFARGLIDGRSDIYALLATAYQAVTGSIPRSMSGNIPQAQRLNPRISAQLNAILNRGLRPLINQRYQNPAELRQDLLTTHSVSGSLIAEKPQQLEQTQAAREPYSATVGRIPHSSQLAPTPTLAPTPPPAPDSLALTLQSLAPAFDEETKSLLPSPEELPPLVERNDNLQAAIMLACILLSLILLIAFSRHGLF